MTLLRSAPWSGVARRPRATHEVTSGRPAGAARGPEAARRSVPARGTVVAVLVTTVLSVGVGATSVAVTVQENARRAEQIRQSSMIAAAAQAADAELQQRSAVARAQDVRAQRAAEMSARVAAVGQAGPPIEAARAALAAAPQASPEARAALQAAIDAAAVLTVADPLPFVSTMNDAVAALAVPQQAVAESQAAWQAAEQARLEAEARAAAERAAAAAAAQAARAPRAAGGSTAAPAPARPGTASRSARAPAPAAAAGSSPAAAAAPAAPAAPAPAGAAEFSAGAVGAAINAHRAAHGLPPLSISRSGALYAHASAMAVAGSIWHGGSDKIVGFVRPASAGSLVSAWAGSPAHNAWMLRADKTSMQIGAAELNGRLYGAVNFS